MHFGQVSLHLIQAQIQNANLNFCLLQNKLIDPSSMKDIIFVIQTSCRAQSTPVYMHVHDTTLFEVSVRPTRTPIKRSWVARKDQ